MLYLWRYHPISGDWINERRVTQETAQDWLKIYQTDSPNNIFEISDKKPKPPKTYWNN